MASSASEEVKMHVVCVPAPSQGHIKPMFDLAKLLHAKGFHITFVNTEYNSRRLSQARGPNALDGLDHFKFEAIPDGLPPSDADVTQDVPTLFYAMRDYFLEPFKKLLLRLNDPSSGSPPVTFIVADCIMPFALDAAQEFGGIPLLWLWAAAACGFLGFAQYRTLVDKGIVPFQDSEFSTNGSLDKFVDWVPSMKGMQLKHLPTFLRTTDKDDIMFNYLMYSFDRTIQSSLPVIFNTFDAFERDALEDISNLLGGPIYTVGPLQLMLKNEPQDTDTKSLRSNLWKEDSRPLNWLDSKDPKSVVYVSFGSITTMTNDNLLEFAWGLANSNHNFLWILRPDLVTGNSAVIPPEFIAETKDRGLVTSWCDQEAVLNHPSIGAFLTHCGWNSTLDTLCGGVPVLCWPFFAEQQTNCWFICEKWGIGMEIDNNVTRTEVTKQVKELMEGEEGRKMRAKAMEWKRLAAEATAGPSGSSYLNFDKLIDKILLPMNYNRKQS